MKANIFLPIFEGFYNTIHDLDESNILNEFIQDVENEELHVEHIIVDKDNTGDRDYMQKIYDKHFTIDYVTYYQDYSKEYTKQFWELCWKDFENIWISSIEFDRLQCPQFYNHWNDEIIVNIKYDTKKLLKFLHENEQKFSKYIWVKNESRDWFHAFWTTDFKKYVTKNNFETFEITQIMDFFLTEIDKEDLYYKVNENLSINDFINNK